MSVDVNRRRFLTTTASVVGGAGAVATSIPFISTLSPSAKTKAIGAPVEVEIGDIQPGELKISQWQGKPVWILRRPLSALDGIRELDVEVSDPISEREQQPEYAKNEYRSVKPEYLIVIGLCTHLGCSPTYVNRDEGGDHNLGSDWKGGFFCPCHGSKFDMAGRVYKGVPAPTNLVVPPHMYLSETKVLIGDDSGILS
ncbi:MAG: ubiquinol-cytochrome c reductase iron-sulfur subunit [Gammaproteobacteria bacterium]|jgi:ubiquinol-cytochrome c reductase iron-sulfur subunit